MKSIGRILLKGLLAILPISLTLYFVYWLGVTTESMVGTPIKWLLGERYYWPGMGLVAGFILLFLIGLTVNAFVLGRMFRYVESLLLRIPVVKTIYSAVRDMTRLVNTSGQKRELERVVTVPFAGGRVIGFITQEQAMPQVVGERADMVAVYLPMSYQIGGYTVYLARSQIEETGLTVEQAMRIAITGGIQGQGGG